MAAAPASCARRANSMPVVCDGSQPERIFTVTGILTAFTIARTTASAWHTSLSSVAPAPVLATLGTQQPMFRSTMSAPCASTTCAASAIIAGSPPKSWTLTGRSASLQSNIPKVLAFL